MQESQRCFRIFGKVQGVNFRHSTRREAERLGLRGYARNLPDGTVEVAVSGETEAMATLRTWLTRGPAHARVERVEDAGASHQSLQLPPRGFRVF